MQAEGDGTEGAVLPSRPALPEAAVHRAIMEAVETGLAHARRLRKSSGLRLKIGWQVVFFVRYEPLVAAAVFGRCGRRGRLFRVAFTNL